MQLELDAFSFHSRHAHACRQSLAGEGLGERAVRRSRCNANAAQQRLLAKIGFLDAPVTARASSSDLLSTGFDDQPSARDQQCEADQLRQVNRFDRRLEPPEMPDDRADDQLRD